MGEAYFRLKHKLEELGYNYQLPLDSVPLVECIFADLVQTTKSLQHYMELSKDALNERESLILAVEPYKCDNARLIQENNKLHQENILLKEEKVKISKEYKFKIKNLTNEVTQKDLLISKLQHDIRDLGLRGLCADTLSSRNRSKKKEDADTCPPKICTCKAEKSDVTDVADLKSSILTLKTQVEEYIDDINILKQQVENRDSEIVRLKMLLEGGRAVKVLNKECMENNPQTKNYSLIKEIKELELANDNLRKEFEKSLEKQHEAMLRALDLADKNKQLQEEMQKVDKLALKVEAECNKKLQTMTNEVMSLQSKISDLSMRNSKLEQEGMIRNSKENSSSKSQPYAKFVDDLQEKQDLQKQISSLTEVNNSLQEKIYSLSQVLNNFNHKLCCNNKTDNSTNNDLLKYELQKVIQDERKKYEISLAELQERLNEAINCFSKYVKDKTNIYKTQEPLENTYIRDLHIKLCEHESKILLLKKENDEHKNKIKNQEDCDKEKYQEIISHLNLENSELSKENILLTKQISQYKTLRDPTFDRGDSCKEEVQKLSKKLDLMNNEFKMLQKDKNEYMYRYKEAMDLVDKLKRDLITKQKEIENLEEENCSYKLSNRTERATFDHMRDECSLLREQMKNLKSKLMEEKTVANQIKNIQIESERSSAEIQSELLKVQKKLSISSDMIRDLEESCKKLQSEIFALQSDKSNLMERVKAIDKERDELVIDLDNKTETVNVLNEKIKTQSYEINKLNNEIVDLKRKLNNNRVLEHKVVDYESQIKFLNEEKLQLSKQYDLAIMENKRLQNDLADANGMLKLTKIEHEKSKRDVDSLKQQLQHYVDEIRRIEELLSQKEAERSDMLEHFASLSVEANILENTNHSLESESASKSLQLQTYMSKIQDLESQISDKDNMIDSQSARIAAMTCKLTALENDVKLLNEEKIILEENIACLKQKCSNMKQSEIFSSKSINGHAAEIKAYENKIKSINHLKNNLEDENASLKKQISTAEKLLSDARREVVELKLALQDATDERKSLHELINKHEDTLIEHAISKEKQDMPIILEDELNEINYEDNLSEHSTTFVGKSYKYGHSSTL
ncbi:centrosomal protein of 135 kDa-like [Aricia agestis]|uniref:centrosomal protein of 135 kDa-like n=1 Tax=Aricia agestis TaxID=91739 RepID=UPI001C20396F|nr:centrosomal protein of 135 kDa-like [Aricia agestis]